MASASLLKDIDEQFLQCSICLDRLVEPKMLPCLHHFCRNCLHDTFQRNQEKREEQKTTNIECPTCRGKHDLPEEGVDGFKSDFNTKKIIEFIQLQESVENEPTKVCIHCSKKLKVSGYCFRCNDFLCETCHEHHLTNSIVKDHRPHIFSLGDVAARHLTVDKLASLREATRCHKHPGKLSELCCNTCGNLPICIACSYGAHKGHDLREVSTLAEEERTKLSGKMDRLMRYKEKIYGMQEKLGSAVESLARTVGERERELREAYNQREGGIKTEIRRMNEQLGGERSRTEEKLRGKIDTRKRELKEEMRLAQERYDKGCEGDRRETDIEFKKIQGKRDREEAKWKKKLQAITTEFQELMTSLQDQQQKQAGEIRQTLELFDETVKRFDNVTKIAASIVAAKNDWTDVQCIPDVCDAIDPLMGEVGKEFPVLDKLTSVSVRGLSALVKDRVAMSERAESIVDIGRPEGGEWYNNGIADNDHGDLVITGARRDAKKSFICVIDMKGRRVRDKLFDSSDVLWRYCESLPQSKIVTACYPNEIGVYDPRNGEYTYTDVSHITAGSTSRWYIYGLTVNPANDDVILSCASSKDMYVFDTKMKHINTLKLPDMPQSAPRDITLHGDNLLVCVYSSDKAYAVSMEGSQCKLVYEFTKPNVSGITCQYPISVCTDRNDFIYMFWQGSPKHILAQYSQDGRQLLATRLVDGNHYSECMQVVERNREEKLLLATYESGKLITYGLS